LRLDDDPPDRDDDPPLELLPLELFPLELLPLELLPPRFVSAIVELLLAV
jgi:hypothetical protein